MGACYTTVMIKMITFDCWNTLFFTETGLGDFAEFAERIGQDLKDREYMKKFEFFMMANDDDCEENVKKLLVDLGVDYDERLVEELCETMLRSTNSVRAYADVELTLGRLSGKYKLGLLSNSRKEAVAELRQRYPLEKYFDIVVLSCECGLIKPDVRIFKKLVDLSELRPDEILMVGDSYHDDYVAAREAGLESVLLDRRDRYPEEKDRIRSLEELEGFIESQEGEDDAKA